MLTLFMLAALLTLGIAAFAALGVEDNRFHHDYMPIRYQTVSPTMMRWEDSLPGKPVLPWNESATEWIESEGK